MRYMLVAGSVLFAFAGAVPRPDLPVAVSILSDSLKTMTVSYQSVFGFPTPVASLAPTEPAAPTVPFQTPVAAGDIPETRPTMSIIKPNGGPKPDFGTISDPWPPAELVGYMTAFELCQEKDFVNCTVAEVAKNNWCQDLYATDFQRFQNEGGRVGSARVMGGSCTIWDVPQCQDVKGWSNKVDLPDKGGLADFSSAQKQMGTAKSWRCTWNNPAKDAAASVVYHTDINMP